MVAAAHAKDTAAYAKDELLVGGSGRGFVRDIVGNKAIGKIFENEPKMRGPRFDFN